MKFIKVFEKPILTYNTLKMSKRNLKDIITFLKAIDYTINIKNKDVEIMKNLQGATVLNANIGDYLILDKTNKFIIKIIKSKKFKNRYEKIKKS